MRERGARCQPQQIAALPSRAWTVSNGARLGGALPAASAASNWAAYRRVAPAGTTSRPRREQLISGRPSPPKYHRRAAKVSPTGRQSITEWPPPITPYHPRHHGPRAKYHRSSLAYHRSITFAGRSITDHHRATGHLRPRPQLHHRGVPVRPSVGWTWPPRTIAAAVSPVPTVPRSAQPLGRAVMRTWPSTSTSSPSPLSCAR